MLDDFGAIHLTHTAGAFSCLALFSLARSLTSEALTSLRQGQQRTSEVLARSRSWLSLLRSPSGIRISFLMPIVFKSCRLETQERKMTWTCVKELVAQHSQIVPTNFFRQSPPEDLEVTR